MSCGSDQKPTERCVLLDPHQKSHMPCSPQGRGAVWLRSPAPLTLGSTRPSSGRHASTMGTQSPKKQWTLAREGLCRPCRKDSGFALHNPALPGLAFELGALTAKNPYSEHANCCSTEPTLGSHCSSLAENLYLGVAHVLWVRPRGPGAVQSAGSLSKVVGAVLNDLGRSRLFLTG